MRRCWSVPSFALCALLQGSLVLAQETPEAEARTHFDRGLVLFGQNNFAGALVEFQRAYELSHRASVLFNLGATYQALHRYPEAARSLESYLAQAEGLAPERRAEVQAVLAQLRALLAYVRVTVTPPEAPLTIDGVAVPREALAEPLALGPDRHTLVVSAEGYETEERALSLASGDHQETAFALRRRVEAPTQVTVRGAPGGAVLELDGRANAVGSPVVVAPGEHRVTITAPGHRPWSSAVLVPPGSTRTITVRLAREPRVRPVFFAVGLATTGALALAGTSFGLLTLATHQSFSQRFQDDPDAQALADRGTLYRTLTNVTFVAAGAFGVATAVLWALSRGGSSSADVALAPTADGFSGSVRLRF
ncbi:MAG: PEGA domain-containing protein [Deltaproteobacteria bacterium]|nr:PEGA domain-containing protein [Deltaproteobacteria bacterium]